MRVHRIEPIDMLTRDEGTLLLYERQVVRLSPLAEEIFFATDAPRSSDELTEHLVAVFGEPPGGATAAVHEALTQLIDQGVLSVASAE